MAQSIREVMTPEPITLPETATVQEAALRMRDEDVGDVIVMRDGAVQGIVTDRDVVVRAVADGEDPTRVKIGSIASTELQCLHSTDTVEDAISLMRSSALRRLPVLEEGQPVGIVSLGDLAMERDPESALATISASQPNA